MKWFAQLGQKFSAAIAHCFVLYGNTRDYVPLEFDKGEVDYKPLSNALARLIKTREIVVFYNRSGGWRFRSEKEETAVSAALAASKAPAAPQNPLAAAITGRDGPFPKAPANALPVIETLLRSELKIAVVVEYAESIFAAGSWTAAEIDTLVVGVLRIATDPQIEAKGNALLMICADSMNSLHPSLRSPESKIEPIFIPYPDQEERQRFVGWYLEKKKVNTKGLSNKQLANLTAGLSYLMIEDVFLRARDTDRLDPSMVKDRKDEIIRAEYGDVIEIVDPRHGWESIGGLDYVVEFFKKNVIQPILSGDTRRCPMGVLMPGPPGTGKSAVAEALAKEAGVNFVTLRLSKIFNMWQGSSERNLEKALRMIEGLAPCIVFMDEIDQAGHSRGGAPGDNGTASRVFQRLLEFMADTHHRGRVVFLAATNRPDLIDSAMKRAGRFDKKIPFLAPDFHARSMVFQALFIKNDIPFKDAGSQWTLLDVANDTEGYVGADLEAIVVKAYELAQDNTKKGHKVTVTGDDLHRAKDLMLPSIDKKDVEVMTALAIKECNDLSLLPPGYRPTKEALDQTIKDAGLREGGREL